MSKSTARPDLAPALLTVRLCTAALLGAISGRSRRFPHSLSVLLACLALSAVLAGCARSDPERELRATIAAMTQAIEQRDAGDFTAALAEDFSRESGAFGKQDARRLLAAVLLRHERITVAAAVTELQIDGPSARVRLRVVATGGAGLLPEAGRIWEIDSAWRRVDGRWQVFNAEWREGF